MHPVIPRDTNAEESIHCQLTKSHYLTIATPIYVESTAKLRMMFCTTAPFFPTIKGWREYTNFTQSTAYTIVTIVYAV